MYEYRVVSTDIAGRATVESQHWILPRAIEAAKKAQRQHWDRGNQILVTVEIRNGNGVWQEAGRAEDY